MKAILCVPLLLASCVWADEATDRMAVEKAISGVSAQRPDPSLFTADFPDSAELGRNQGTAGTVVISKEPWGEATWISARTPRFVIRTVRFVTPDVALVDGIDRQNENSAVVFVMKREGADWKIASFKRIAPPVARAARPAGPRVVSAFLPA